MADVVEWRRRQLLATAEPRHRRTRKPSTLRQRLSTWNNIPEFLKDNEYIRTGYRANWSPTEALASLFQLHNETLNVWIHLLGFFIFLALTVYVATGPPSSFVHPRESLEQLWTSVQDTMHHWGDHIGDHMHALHGSEDLRIGLLQASLHEAVSTIQMQLHENLEHARDSWRHKMEPVSNKMHKLFSSLSDALHHFQSSLGHMDSSLHTRLHNARANLEKSFGSVQESLHVLQHDLSGNLGAGMMRLRKSVSSLQENLTRLQALLRDTHSREANPLFQNSTVGDHCPNIALMHYLDSLRSVRDHVVRWPVFLYMSGVMFCLLVSSICHLFACCSQHASRYMWRFDYTGIAVLIVTSFYPVVYYGFLCESHWVAIYLSCTTVLGAGTVVASLVSYMQQPKFRPLRAGMFSGLGLFGVIPCVHQVLINFHEPIVRMVIAYEIIMAAFYLGGAALFVARIPERFKPGAFDILLSSHQIFHIFVVIGACIHFQVPHPRLCHHRPRVLSRLSCISWNGGIRQTAARLFRFFNEVIKALSVQTTAITCRLCLTPRVVYASSSSFQSISPTTDAMSSPRAQQTVRPDEETRANSAASDRRPQTSASGPLDAEAQIQEKLHTAQQTLTVAPPFPMPSITASQTQDAASVEQAMEEVRRATQDSPSREGTSQVVDEAYMQALQSQLSQSRAQVAALRAAFEERCSKERKLSERICQLESAITQNETAVPEGLTLENEMASLKSRLTSFRQDAGVDKVILEKLNLAYEDLIAIYDLRMDIDQQLNAFHYGCMDPTLKKDVIKLVRDRELELRAQRHSK